MHTCIRLKLTDRRQDGWTDGRSDGRTNEKKSYKPIEYYTSNSTICYLNTHTGGLALNRRTNT